MKRLISVGSFELAEPLAQGGMGSVWRALHRSGVAAAVKIIPAESTGGLDAASTLQAEIRSVGALDHPNIVRLFDAGMLEAEHEAASGGELRAGSPWLAMELADGSVHDLLRSLDWDRLVSLLLQVLDALAHAHARGVVHRDLKPANLLYVRSHTERILLADFGLAWRRGTDLLHGGSLPYAAPEQILGVRTEQGPWTDLYGLGCCAYRLATGSRPYRGSDPEQIKRGHLFAAIPRPRPRFPVPADFGDWLAVMMAKDPSDRFSCAADAAYALLQLSPSSDPGRAAAERAPATLPVSHWARVESAGGLGAPPVPADWAQVNVDRPHPFAGRGLGLFGLRVPPITGRTAERDRLWEILAGLDRPQIVVLRGGAGTGKSRLAAWLVERAYEVGAAEAFRARFEPASEGRSGLAEMVEGHLNTHGLETDEIVGHLRHRLSPHDPAAADREVYALARLLRPDDATLTDPLPASERVAVAWRVVRRQRLGRRLIVWLDDVQHDGEALSFVEHAVDAPEPPAVLFVVTVRDEPAPIRNRLRALVDRLEGTEFVLEPMSVRELEMLVHRMLPVERELAARIAGDAGGSPLVAVQLVAALVERGALRGDPGGIRLSSTDHLPASLADFWSGALDRLDVPGARDALRIAAVLGGTFAHAQWRDVAQRLEQPIDGTLLAALVNRGFVVPERSSGRYSFAHPLLREVLLGEARAAGVEIDMACAGSLAAKGPAFAARAAEHLEAAGALISAADACLVALRWLSEWDRERAVEMAERWFALLGRSGISETDPRWIAGLGALVDLYAVMGDHRRHLKAIEALRQRGQVTGDQAAEIRALIELAKLDTRALALDRAEARSELAVRLSRGTPLQSAAAVVRAELRRYRGDLRTAEAALRQVLLVEGGDQAAIIALSEVLCEAGRGTEALKLLAEWVDQLGRAQPPLARARIEQAHGRALMALGRASAAVDALVEAERIRAGTGFDWPALDLDRGAALLAAGRPAEANALLEPLLERIRPEIDVRHRGLLLALLAELTEQEGAAHLASRHLQDLEALPTRGHAPATLAAVRRVVALALAGEHHTVAHRARRWIARAEQAAAADAGRATDRTG